MKAKAAQEIPAAEVELVEETPPLETMKPAQAPEEAFASVESDVALALCDAERIVVTSEDQTDLMAAARAQRLILRQLRLTVERTHRDAKEYWLRGGQRVDNVKRSLVPHLEREEKRLLECEQFQERAIMARQQALQQSRMALLAPLDMPGAATMTLHNLSETEWADTLSTATAMKETREARVRAEAEARAKAEAEAAAEAAHIRAENARLQAEAQSAAEARRLQEAAAAEERRKTEAEHRRLQAQAQAAQAEAAAARRQAEAEAQKRRDAEAEAARRRLEAQAQAAREEATAARQKAEAAAAALREEARIAAEAQAKAERDADAPDAEKMQTALTILTQTKEAIRQLTMAGSTGQQHHASIMARLTDLMSFTDRARWELLPY